MSRSRFLSSTSLALALLGAACDDDPTCGPLGAPSGGMLATAGDATLAFDSFTGGQNGDCPDPDAPGTPSLTIIGKLAGGMSGFITVCIPHPERANAAGRTLGPDQSDADFLLVDVAGSANNCTFKLDQTSAAGTGQTEGLCDAGASAAGFALILDGTVMLDRDCNGTKDKVSATLSGRVAVQPL